MGELLLQKSLKLSDLIKLRESRDAASFRDCSTKNCDQDPVEITRAYVELLTRLPWISSWTGRVLRFVTTSALGAALGAVFAAQAYRGQYGTWNVGRCD